MLIRPDDTRVAVTADPYPQPGIDTAVLEVPGGLLSWNILAAQPVPVALIDDPVAAQDWLWALYGEQVATEVVAGRGTAPFAPVQPKLHTDSQRLAYALWAARWWPASTLDGIPPLDTRLLAKEIAELADACDPIVDGDLSIDQRPARAGDYALAAGTAILDRTDVVLRRGTTGTDWHRYPPGLVDASEQAVSWVAVRTAGRTEVRVTVVAAPDLVTPVPDHLRPHANGVALSLAGDVWIGTLDSEQIDIHVPGFGVPGAGDPGLRSQIREFVRARLRRAPDSDLLLAEIDAATADPDF